MWDNGRKCYLSQEKYRVFVKEKKIKTLVSISALFVSLLKY